MKFIDSLAMAVKSLFANKLRSSLTMLGIIIGVGAVISLMSVGRGAETAVTSTFQQLGTNAIYVVPFNPGAPGMAGLSSMNTSPTLTMSDARALERIQSIVSIAPVNENFVEVIFGAEGKAVVLHGATPEYQELYNYTLSSGRFISDRDVASGGMVLVLGGRAAEELFGYDDPVGQRVKIKGKRFSVIGVLEAKGGQMMGVSMDDIVVTPLTTFQTRLFTQRTTGGEDAVQSIAVQVSNAELIDVTIEEIEAILRKEHRLPEDEKDDFAVVSQEQIVGMLGQVTGVFTIFLGAVASIALLVGGIGIMNIMLVSVTERTREIGIRMAIGAKRRDILIQFLLEASMLSLLGGGIGIIGGSALAYVVSHIDISGYVIPSVVSPDVVLLALLVSVFIGLASGLYPAVRAARLNPIDALHYG